jgi:protein-S-isoprenylcysteine O-methyltransferase Ste14/uncharacterized membrane protein (UPF0127 family)
MAASVTQQSAPPHATYRARVAGSATMIADRLRPAHTHWTRLKGLLGTKRLKPGEGLWIKPCSQVHMIGMRYAVDLVFLDANHRVVHTIAALAPNRISPHVAEATSVLELPVGTVAHAQLAPGTQIEVEGTAATRSASSRADVAAALICNIALAALYTVFAMVHVESARHSGNWATKMPVVIQEALLVALFLTRHRSIATSSRLWDWAIGIVGTFLPMLLRPASEVGWLNWLGQPVQILGLSLAVVSIGFLRRSVGIVAANRGIKTSGIYGLVRHPLYAAYILAYVGYVASYPTSWNCVITLATLLALNARAIAEERFLRRDPLYREYLRLVPWRFMPYVY